MRGETGDATLLISFAIFLFSDGGLETELLAVGERPNAKNVLSD